VALKPRILNSQEIEKKKQTQICVYCKNSSSDDRVTCFGWSSIIGVVFTNI
jgi:hypothetical protein